MDKNVYEALVQIVGISANAISELCEICHEIILFSCNSNTGQLNKFTGRGLCRTCVSGWMPNRPIRTDRSGFLVV